jgi:hypothetical protein
MLFRRRPAQRSILPSVEQAVRARPDHMYLAPTFIAVYHSGTDKVLFIPHDNQNMTNDEATALMRERVKQYNQKINKS